MTPEQRAAIVDYYTEAREALDSTGRHAGHTARQVGRCIYCSCGWRVGQEKLSKRDVIRDTPHRRLTYREAHTSIPRPPGDRYPNRQ